MFVWHDHSIDLTNAQISKQERDFGRASNTSRFKEQSSSPKVRKTSQKEESKREAPMESTPERVTVSYPSELSMLDRCADLQGGHWTILGTESKFIGPASHFEVVNHIPEMDEDFDSERKESEQGQGPNIVNQKIIPPPIPETDLLAPPYFGWMMPVAVRATSGHSVHMHVELKPELIMRRLTLKTAFKLKGAFHVTSPTHLMSILKHGIVPGGEKQRRLMSFFGVFPLWDERNRVTRTRSPNEGELQRMLIIYIPPTELIRCGAGVSNTGDIMVDSASCQSLTCKISQCWRLSCQSACNCVQTKNPPPKNSRSTRVKR